METNSYSTHTDGKAARIPNPFLLKCKNFLKFGRRWSSNPPKQLLFTWLGQVFARSDQFNTTLDIACGNLNNYPFIKSPNYIGVDMNKASLDYGKIVYPKAKTENRTIEELDKTDLKGDLVICTQTIGVNSYFILENTLPNIKTIVNCTNPQGTLVFDIGKSSMVFLDEIDAILNENFAKVEAKDYGGYNRKSSLPVSIFLAALMQFFPSMRHSDDQPKRLYICDEKLPLG